MATTQTQLRKGTTAQNNAFTGALAEVTVDTDKNVAIVHNAAQAGGFPLAGTLYANVFVPTQTFAATENFFGSAANPDNRIAFLNPAGVGTNTYDFNTNGTLNANFLRKYNTTPFNIELAASGSLDFVIDSRNVATGTSIRFLTNGIRDSGTQILLAEFEDNGMVNLTGALSMGTNLINNVVNPVAAQDAATKSYVDGLIAAGAPPFTDSTALVKGSGDPTKLLRFEVDGFTAATTRVLTPPNADITLAGINIAQTFTLLQTFSSGVALADGANLFWLTRSSISSPSDGVLRLTNNGQIDFTRLQFGGTTAAFPAIGRNGVNLEILGADGAGPSGLFIYNTKTSATNFERLDIQWAGNVAQIWTEKGSIGGTARRLTLGTNGVGRLDIEPAGQILWGNGASLLETDGSLILDIANNFFNADVTAGVITIGSLATYDVSGGALGFFGSLAAQGAVVSLTNNATGGTANTVATFGQITYTTDAPVILGNFNQLATKVNQIITALKNYGLLTP